MDVEKTIEFILESQARLQAMFEAGADRTKEDAARAKLDAERATEDSTRAKHDAARATEDAARAKLAAERAKEDVAEVNEQMANIRQILRETAFIQQEQARVLVRLESNIAEVAAAQKELANAQKITEVTFKAFLESLGRGNTGGNGKKQ